MRYLPKSLPRYRERLMVTKISVPLKAEINYGFPVKWLKDNWSGFISNLMNTKYVFYFIKVIFSFKISNVNYILIICIYNRYIVYTI